ncbi:hypothetical protein DL240_06880 [Lujinxingia litoralis]|uniref:Endonuclease I n=1 Tax=Lujinxingia litoralis TaxID=2211119 RepID=A0A328CCG7_9DELT|nr:endonuclease [Lujinxingia litoralis]RAL23867.1 hypothetical protein DL240_06880 [Lujinxingia litoralis]
MRHTTRLGVIALCVALLNACSADPTNEPDADLIITEDTGIEDAGDSDLLDTDTDVPDTEVPDADIEEPDADDSDAGESPEPWSCAPELSLEDGRYNDLNDLSDVELIAELHERVDGHTGYTYRAARDLMYAEVDGIDTQLDGFIHCPYTGRTATPNGSRTPDNFNTEHSWPRSNGAGSFPAEGDIHHLFPTYMPSNSARSSYEFGHTDCAGGCSWSEGGSKLGPSTDSRTEPVFEVRMQNRGDIARAHFYFSVRYELSIPPQEEAVLRQWNCQDPPDDWERLRNDRVEAVQDNRNPFIDRPDFVDQIADF